MIVNALFLKSPRRIEALGLILVLALMVWRLMERTMRVSLKESNSKVVGWNNRQTSGTSDCQRPVFHQSFSSAPGQTEQARSTAKRHWMRPPDPHLPQTTRSRFSFSLSATRDLCPWMLQKPRQAPYPPKARAKTLRARATFKPIMRQLDLKSLLRSICEGNCLRLLGEGLIINAV